MKNSKVSTYSKISKGLTFKVAALAIGKTMRRMIGTVSLIILVRVLSKEDVGSYKQILFIIGLIVTTFQLGIPKSLLYFVPKADAIERRQFISQGFLMLSCLGIVGTIGLYILSDYLSEIFNNPSIAELLRLYAPAVFFLLISTNYFTTILVSLGKHVHAACAQVLIGLPNNIAIILAALLGASLFQLLSVSLVVIATLYLVLVLLMRRINKSLFYTPHYGRIVEVIKYAAPLSLALVSGLIAVQIDKVVISLYFTATTFAVYAVGSTRIPFIGHLYESISATIIPMISIESARNRKTEIENLCNRGVRKIALFIFPIFCFLFIFAEEFISLLYTENFIEAVPVFRVYLFLAVLKISFCGIIILGSGRTEIVLWTTGFTLIVNIILNFALVKYFGVIGPAIATVWSRLLHQGIFIICVQRILGYRVRALFPTNELLLTFVVCFLSGILVFPVTWIGLSNIWLFLALVPSYSLLCLAGFFLLDLITIKERQMLTNYILQTLRISSEAKNSAQ